MILVVGRADSALCQGILVAALVTCGYMPVSLSSTDEKKSELAMGLPVPLDAGMVVGAISGAGKGYEKDAEVLVAKFASRGSARARVGF